MFFSTISLRRLLTIFVILFFWKVKFVLLVSHQSNLCQPMDMPCGRGNEYECRMKYFKLNSTDCRDLAFANSRTAENDLGKVQIQSYHYNLRSYKQTGLNLTFSNITWNHFKFRFKQEDNEMKNTCREFYMSGNSSIKNLFYDCLWSNENYEGKTFTFEYEASNELLVSYRKYSFRVPYAKNIEDSTEIANWEIFILVELIKNTFGLTTFIIHWQPLPERFSTHTYNLSVISNESAQTEITYYTNITCYDLNSCKYLYNKWYGSVQFGIQPVCRNGSECLVTKTVIFNLGGENAKPLLIGLVSVILIIPTIMYVLFLLRNYLVKKSKKWIRPVPKLLIVFTPSLSSHVNVVFALVEYLKMYCNVEPLVDELHIFYSKSRDPFKWCNETFKTADLVVVVASPYHKHLRLADSVYQNTDILLLRLLRERLASRESKARFFVLMLPYCSERDIPSEAINLRRFSFPEDLNKMLRFIHRERSYVECFSSEVQGGRECYKLFGTKLSNAITETQVNLKKNKSEYDRMIEELRNEKEFESDEALLTCSRNNKEKPSEYKPKGKRRTVLEGMFGEFPGRLDDMNLSGEEREILVGSQKIPNDVVNLDELDL